MKAKILYADCPACGYQNTFLTNRKYRKGLQTFKWPCLTWRCDNCGEKFDSKIQWMTLGFEGWCAFWLYHYRFNWKIPGIAILVCALFVTIAVYFDSYLRAWLQPLAMLVAFIGMGAGFLLLREIPYAYPVYLVNERRGT
jgi:hypothetical protein